METKELKTKSAQELSAHIAELRQEQFNLRMQRGSGQLTQTHQIKRVRKDVARAKTVLGQKK
ncbi:50S ribosomal protein L29 [Ahniella affigens]|uniref:Large ribosomal subunit protein uL29 n=1 Tax=Ahniella affigens TaxID=2021234 RepID=A0A2P1PUT9_9GAMM|nr:50S ribosomal protein L29 [Ahniella affigens]AVP98617.1 50S ribosomal protein L29 [Ahniella affigens]